MTDSSAGVQSVNQPQKGAAMSGAELIAAERQRQIDVEGWTPEHDREHYGMSDDLLTEPPLLLAARAYLDQDWTCWPWELHYYKPTPDDRERELVKAGALIAAEIDRLRGAS